MTLDLTPDQLLSTTRAVRKRLDLDRPVPLDVVRECLELAVQAPTGSNQQGWHFVVVTDEAKRAALGAIYKKAFDVYETMPFAAGNLAFDDAARARTQQRVQSSARYLADVMGRCPVHLIPCIEGKLDGMPNMASSSILGSIIPAAWSFCLAAGARPGHLVDLVAPVARAGGGRRAGHPVRLDHAGGPHPGRLHEGHGLQAGAAEPIDTVLHVDGW